MTEGRNIDAQTAAGFENGAALLKLPGLIVYRGVDHALVLSLRRSGSNLCRRGYD